MVQEMVPIIPSLLPLAVEVGKLQKKTHTAMAVDMVEGVMSPTIGVGEHPMMAGGVVMSPSPIIGVVMSLSPITGVVELAAIAVHMAEGVMSQSPIIGVVK